MTTTGPLTSLLPPLRKKRTIDDSRSRPPLLAGAGIALAVPLAIFVAHALRYGQWLVDDALISLSYARTLSEGGGLAQSTGDAPVEGVSNPAWTLLLTSLRLAGLIDHGHEFLGISDDVWCIRTLAALCFVGTLACLHCAARALLPSSLQATSAALLAGLILATSPNYVIWAVSGLENPLYGLLVAALAATLTQADAQVALLRVRPAALCALLALLLAATRPDGAIFVAAFPVLVALRTATRPATAMRAGATYVLVFGVPAVALLLWRQTVFNLWVPNTAVAKSQQLDLHAVPGQLLDLLAAAGGWAVSAGALFVATAVAIPLLTRKPTSQRWAGLLVPLVLSGSAFVLLNRDWMAEYRFSTPAAVLGAGLVGVAASRCLALSASLRWKLPCGLLIAVFLAGHTISTLPRVEAFVKAPTVPGCFVADRYGRATDAYADALGIRTGTFLVPDIGGVLLTSRLQVVDLAGLTDPTIARFRRAQDWAGLRNHLLEDVRPTFVHLHRPWDPGLVRDPRFRRDYVELVPRSDFVRRDATSPLAVKHLIPQAKAWAAQAAASRAQTPTIGCRPLVRR